jgi:peptidoglycan L-alanyl-D-glutamate endopeptidase CwlK
MYFCVAVSLAALLLLPDLRDACTTTARRVTLGVAQQIWRFNIRSRTEVIASTHIARDVFGNFWMLITRYRVPLVVAVVILAIPPFIALSFRHRFLFHYDDAQPDPDQKIAALLGGEQLVAPPALPPMLFSTPEVEQVRPALVDASRDWNLIDADFRQRLLMVYKIMREQYGYQMALLEGYRSPERQNRLAASGSNVTNAAAYQSYHQYGLAADNAFIRDGKIVISEKDPWAMRGYQLYGQTAESVGLVWGGRWKLMDFGHVEYHKPGFVMPHR